jgi:hypothetical protein
MDSSGGLHGWVRVNAWRFLANLKPRRFAAFLRDWVRNDHFKTLTFRETCELTRTNAIATSDGMTPLDLDANATEALRPAAREALLAALEVGGNPSSIHGGGRAGAADPGAGARAGSPRASA